MNVTDSAAIDSNEYAGIMAASTREGELFIGEGTNFQVDNAFMQEQLQCVIDEQLQKAYAEAIELTEMAQKLLKRTNETDEDYIKTNRLAGKLLDEANERIIWGDESVRMQQVGSCKRRGRPVKQKEVHGGQECNPPDDLVSQYSDSQSLHCLVESVDEGEVNSVPNGPKFKEDRDLVEPKLKVGMTFESPEKFRMLLRHYAIVNGFDLAWPKNEGPRIIATCMGSRIIEPDMEENCSFRVYAFINNLLVWH